MSDGSVENCGFDACDISQDRFDVVQRQFHRRNRRRAVFGKWIGHVLDLSEGTVRFQQVETCEPHVPVLEAAQSEKRRGRPYAETFVAPRGNVAAAAMDPRNLLAEQPVTIIGDIFDDFLDLGRQRERLASVDLESRDRALAGRIRNPRREPGCPLMVRRNNFDRPGPADSGKDRRADIAERSLGRLTRRDQLDAYLGLESKARQHVFHQAAISQRIGDRQPKLAVVGAGNEGCTAGKKEKRGYQNRSRHS